MLPYFTYLKMCRALSLRLGSSEVAHSNKKLRKFAHVILLLSSEKFIKYFLSSGDFFQNQLFGDLFQEYLECVKQFGS